MKWQLRQLTLLFDWNAQSTTQFKIKLIRSRFVKGPSPPPQKSLRLATPPLRVQFSAGGSASPAVSRVNGAGAGPPRLRTAPRAPATAPRAAPAEVLRRSRGESRPQWRGCPHTRGALLPPRSAHLRLLFASAPKIASPSYAHTHTRTFCALKTASTPHSFCLVSVLHKYHTQL